MTRAKKPTPNVKSPRPAGNEGHRDEAELFQARAEAYRLHTFEYQSFRTIAEQMGTTASTIKTDVDWYTRYLQGEVPATFEAWRTKLNSMYTDQYQKAENLYESAESTFVKAQAVKMMTEITMKMADLFGVTKAISPPRQGEIQGDDEVEWSTE